MAAFGTSRTICTSRLTSAIRGTCPTHLTLAGVRNRRICPVPGRAGEGLFTDSKKAARVHFGRFGPRPTHRESPAGKLDGERIISATRRFESGSLSQSISPFPVILQRRARAAENAALPGPCDAARYARPVENASVTARARDAAQLSLLAIDALAELGCGTTWLDC